MTGYLPTEIILVIVLTFVNGVAVALCLATLMIVVKLYTEILKIRELTGKK